MSYVNDTGLVWVDVLSAWLKQSYSISVFIECLQLIAIQNIYSWGNGIGSCVKLYYYVTDYDSSSSIYSIWYCVLQLEHLGLTH